MTASYFLHVKTFSRGTGSSVTKAAAYRAGERIRDERSGAVHDYTKRTDAAHAEIVLPGEYAGRAELDWARNRSTLWNAAQQSGKFWNSRIGREVLVLMPEGAADEYYLSVYPGAEEAGFAGGGLSQGLPYFLQDQRPDGFLGRAIPGRYPELNLPERVVDWNDDQYLRYLTRHGSTDVGDLVLGDPAFDEFLTPLPHRQPVLRGERAARYPS